MDLELQRLEPGSLVDIIWADISEEACGNPEEAEPSVMTHTYRFVKWEKFDIKGHIVPCGVFTTTKIVYEDDEYYSSCIFPIGCILGIRIIGEADYRQYRLGEKYEE
jgi:hypothetical protein